MADIINFLSGKILRFHAQLNGEKWYTVVEVPNLSPLSYERWADWGPNYRWMLPAHLEVKIHYADGTSISEQRVLELESPILAKLRKKYPFQFTVIDSERKVEYKLYLNKAAEVMRVETRSTQKATRATLARIRALLSGVKESQQLDYSQVSMN